MVRRGRPLGGRRGHRHRRERHGIRAGRLHHREQFAAILWRYAQSKGYDVSASADLTGFLDYGQISEYALPALQWAVGAGVMSGRGDGILAPQGTATRAEAAAMLMRFVENVK